MDEWVTVRNADVTGMSEIEDIRAALREFAEERRWEMNPKNVTMALNVEAGELLELFQWLTPEQSAEYGVHLERERVEEEMADVFIYLLNLANQLDVDIAAAARRKMARNAVKYPVG